MVIECASFFSDRYCYKGREVNFLNLVNRSARLDGEW